jgi:hypothetical protein
MVSCTTLGIAQPCLQLLTWLAGVFIQEWSNIQDLLSSEAKVLSWEVEKDQENHYYYKQEFIHYFDIIF